MSSAEVERFVADLKSNDGLRSELSGHASGVGSVVAFAKDKGYDVTAEDVAALASAQAGRDLSDDELDAVAGGQGQPVTTAVTTETTAVSMIINGEVVVLSSSIVGVY